MCGSQTNSSLIPQYAKQSAKHKTRNRAVGQETLHHTRPTLDMSRASHYFFRDEDETKGVAAGGGEEPVATKKGSEDPNDDEEDDGRGAAEDDAM
jgi:hypothetical protein